MLRAWQALTDPLDRIAVLPALCRALDRSTREGLIDETLQAQAEPGFSFWMPGILSGST